MNNTIVDTAAANYRNAASSYIAIRKACANAPTSADSRTLNELTADAHRAFVASWSALIEAGRLQPKFEPTAFAARQEYSHLLGF